MPVNVLDRPVTQLANMGYGIGFGIYPRLEPTPANKERYASFINEIMTTFFDEAEDNLVELVTTSKGTLIEFMVGEHPIISYNCDFFLRFSSKVSGGLTAAAEPYIRDV